MDAFWLVLLLAITAPYWLPCVLIAGALGVWFLARIFAGVCEGITFILD